MGALRLAVTLLPLLIAACGVADIPGSSSSAAVSTVASGKPASGPVACSTSGSAPLDATQLAKCECKSGGSARCVPSDKIPPSLASQLDTCDGGACVPDTVLAAPDHPLPSCTAKGKEGRCLSMCVPLVAKYGDSVLSRGDGDACPADERCVPCDNPLDGSPTGVCQVAAPQAASCGPAASGAAPPSGKQCCASGAKMRGTCVASSSVSPDVQGLLSKRECSSGELCAPSEVVPNAKPVRCGGGVGVCVSDCVSVSSSLFAPIIIDAMTCQLDERCVPCFDPITGEDLKIPGCT
jgi:hypothetical protein